MSECLDENSALELLDGRVPSAKRVQLERHIESCDLCRELIVELTKLHHHADDDHVSGVADTEPLAKPLERSSLTQAGPYRIEREIGSGAAGIVYRAVDMRTSQVVALKHVTDPTWRARFGREIEMLSRLVHPGIVRYVGHGEIASGLYLAMEWLDGEDLEQCIRRRGPLPWQLVRLLGLRLTTALAHAHSLGAVHRDLTPRNVFLPGGRFEEAKLLDFGLVRIRDDLERTASHAVLGTPFYMAPEQVKDPKNVDFRADLFALGVLFFEAVSGVRPFQGDDIFTLWIRIVDSPAPNLRSLTQGIPEAFHTIIEALLSKEPTSRPASAMIVHESLLLLDGLARSHHPQSLPQPPQAFAYAPPPTPSRAGVYVAVGVGMAALAIVSTIAVTAGLYLTRKTDPETPAPATETATPTATPSAEARAVPPAVLPAKTTSPAPAPAPVPVPPPPKPAAAKETLFCGGDSREQRRGGNYQPDPQEPEKEPVSIGGTCQAVLEDCTIGGVHSVQVLGKSELTLRRCRVLGRVKLVGEVTLILEGTALPSPPQITGKARVVRR